MKKKIKNLIPDYLYLSLKFFRKLNYIPNFKKPKTFNEKINYLKLYDDIDIKTDFQDKLLVKSLVGSLIGEAHIIKTLKILDINESFEEQLYDFDNYVLKTNFESGKVYFSEDNNFSYTNVQRDVRKQFTDKSYLEGREYAYQRIVKKVFIEQQLPDYINLFDYKFYCFNGVPRYVHVDRDRHSSHKRSFYDMNWKKVENLGLHYPYDSGHISKPSKFEDMKEYASIISQYFKFARVDFYYQNHNIYLGEVTFYPGSGFEKFTDKNFDLFLGSLLNVN